MNTTTTTAQAETSEDVNFAYPSPLTAEGLVADVEHRAIETQRVLDIATEYRAVFASSESVSAAIQDGRLHVHTMSMQYGRVAITAALDAFLGTGRTGEIFNAVVSR